MDFYGVIHGYKGADGESGLFRGHLILLLSCFSEH